MARSSTLRVGLGIPFRDSGDRLVAFNKVITAIPGLYSWSSVEVVDTDHPTFNRAAARNKAVRLLEDMDVVVLLDADSLPEPEPLREAIESVATSALVHFPFTTVRVLDRNDEEDYTYGPSQGGCFVFSPGTWWRIGGMDERLHGWGYEDRAFLVANKRVTGGPVFHDGTLTCFYHSREDVVVNPNDKLIYQEYDSNG